jgi:hypothetical protein
MIAQANLGGAAKFEGNLAKSAVLPLCTGDAQSSRLPFSDWDAKILSPSSI